MSFWTRSTSHVDHGNLRRSRAGGAPIHHESSDVELIVSSEESERRWSGNPWSGWGNWSMPGGSSGSAYGLGFGGRGQAPTSTGTGPVLDWLTRSIKDRFLGRRRTITTTVGELGFTLTDLDVPLGASALSVGQLGSVRATASDIEWRDLRLEQVDAVLCNTHVQPGPPAEVVSAPVHVRARLDQAGLDLLLAKVSPALTLEVTADSGLVLRWRAHPNWAHCEVVATADGTTLWLRPAAVVRGARRLEAVRRLPAVPVRLPLPADRVSLTELEVGDGYVELVGRVDVVRMSLASMGLEQLMDKMNGLGTFSWRGWSR